MKYYYDLHLHSALSPCGDMDMTPNNIVNMAKISGLDIIAVTDHNSAGNCRAVEKVGREKGLVVLSGIELETSEEVHIIMLFDSAEKAEQAHNHIKQRQLKIPLKKDVYGQQIYYDESDNEIGEEENLLTTATDIGVYEVVKLATRYGGIAYPAHIDRQSNGIIQMLGDVADDMNFSAVEVSKNASDELIEKYQKRGYKIIYSSDAHYLYDINEQSKNF